MRLSPDVTTCRIWRYKRYFDVMRLAWTSCFVLWTFWQKR